MMIENPRKSTVSAELLYNVRSRCEVEVGKRLIYSGMVEFETLYTAWIAVGQNIQAGVGTPVQRDFADNWLPWRVYGI
jgi:hypothetical protein